MALSLLLEVDMEQNNKNRKKIQIKRKSKRRRLSREELRQLPFVEGWDSAFLSQESSRSQDLPLKVYLNSKRSADRLTVIWPF
jgi:hypothetical protein